MIAGRTLSRALYRARQFSNVFRAGLRAEERAALSQMLSPELLPLFLGMHPVAQRHHIDVCQHLRRDGWDDPDVLAAALLHDVGKGRLGAVERAAIVVAQNLTPLLLRPGSIPHLLRHGPLDWFALQAAHAERGAAMVAAAGGSDRTVELIRRHEGPLDAEPARTALRGADDRY